MESKTALKQELETLHKMISQLKSDLDSGAISSDDRMPRLWEIENLTLKLRLKVKDIEGDSHEKRRS